MGRRTMTLSRMPNSSCRACHGMGSIRMTDNAVWSAILPALLAEARTDPTVEDALRNVWAWRIGVLTEILDRAKARREIPADTDVQHVREVLDGPILLRIVVTGEAMDLVFADRLVEDAMAVINRSYLMRFLLSPYRGTCKMGCPPTRNGPCSGLPSPPWSAPHLSPS